MSGKKADEMAPDLEAGENIEILSDEETAGLTGGASRRRSVLSLHL